MAARLSGRPSPRRKIPLPSTEEEGAREKRPSKTSDKFFLWLVMVFSGISAIAVIGTALFFTVGPGINYFQNNASLGETQVKYEPGPMIHLGQFTLNLGDIEERRFLRTQLTAEFYTSDPAYIEGNEAKKSAWIEELEAETQRKSPLFKDVIVSTVSQKSATELDNEAGKEMMKAELITRLNQYLSKETHIRHIYLTDFIIQ